MSKILHIVHRIIWLIFFISIACNIAFIYINIHNAGPAGSASERIENELNNAANSITSASGTVKQLSGTITDSTERCGDIEQTIRELRKEIGVLEKDCNNSVNSGNC